MACFLVPMALGIGTTGLRNKIPAKYHINWLNMLLWGGTAGLALEHIAHQEIVPYFPFLTAMGSASETMVMLQEMATIGVAMTVACAMIWLAMLAISSWMGVRSKAGQPAQ
ncbi:MAG: hypothetical protein HZB92_01055 [Euryarchaeota archaeon]|nr:hypothetical protein [Euryarchaeota archaeon]